MELRQLQQFLVLASELHFGRAARRLGMTQPPLSQAIQRLEQELGTQLFTRTRRSVALTLIGSKLVPKVQALVDDAREIKSLAAQLTRGDAGDLRLGFSASSEYFVLPKILGRFAAEYPNVYIYLKNIVSDQQVEALLEKKVDAGLILSPVETTFPQSISRLPLTCEPMVLIVPDEWTENGRIPESAHDRLDLIRNETLILPPRPIWPAMYDMIRQFFLSQGVTPQIREDVGQIQTILALVSAGLGVAMMPRSYRNLRHTGVTYVELEGVPPTATIELIWRNDVASPVVARLLEVARAWLDESLQPELKNC